MCFLTVCLSHSDPVTWNQYLAWTMLWYKKYQYRGNWIKHIYPGADLRGKSEHLILLCGWWYIPNRWYTEQGLSALSPPSICSLWQAFYQWLTKMQHVPLKVPRKLQLKLFLLQKVLLLTFKGLLSRENYRGCVISKHTVLEKSQKLSNKIRQTYPILNTHRKVSILWYLNTAVYADMIWLWRWYKWGVKDVFMILKWGCVVFMMRLNDEEEVCVREREKGGSRVIRGGREVSAGAPKKAKKAKKAKSGNNLTSVSLLMVQAMMQMIAFLQVCVSFSCWKGPILQVYKTHQAVPFLPSSSNIFWVLGQ